MATLQKLKFLSRAQVLDLVPVTYPTLWHWMRAGKFPLARAMAGGSRSVWLEHEVLAWLAAQPVREFKAPGSLWAQPVKKLKPPDEKPKVTKRRRVS